MTCVVVIVLGVGGADTGDRDRDILKKLNITDFPNGKAHAGRSPSLDIGW
jgi:hypothetical protein